MGELGGGYLYKQLNKDIKEINKVFISLFCVGIMLIAIFIGVSMTKTSYALFKDTIKGEKTIEVVVDTLLNKTTVFSYTGSSQEYEIPKDGYYYIELAGAEGEGDYNGAGAKTSGYIYLEQGEMLYFYVGGTDGYNGGGQGTTSSNIYSGGGATDVRLVNGTWDNTSSLISRIMVAGGGGVESHGGSGGPGGTLYGGDGVYNITDTYNGYIQDGLVLWFDGYANSGTTNRDYSKNIWKDLSGNNNDVTVSGATWYNNYLSFDGTNDYAYKTSGAIYNISKEHTIEVLLKPRKVASSYQSIFNTVNSGTNVLQYGSLWIHETMQIGFDTGDGSTTYDTNRFDIRTDDIGKYFLMTSIRNDRNYKLYNKGKFINELNYTFDARTPNPAIYIGGQSTSTNLFNGEIYSIRVYNKALTEEELLHNYNYDKEKFNLNS